MDLDAARTGDPVNLVAIEAICAAVSCRGPSGGGGRGPGPPGCGAVGRDARGRDVAVRGWVTGGGVDLLELATRFDASGVSALVVTEIGRDGTLAGPDLEQLSAVLEAGRLPVIASGGVGTLADLHALDALETGGRRLAGAIVGRALYEGRFDVADALGVLARK